MGVYNHFLSKAAQRGLHFDRNGNLAGRFQDLAAERDMAEQALRSTGRYYGQHFRLDSSSIAPQTYRRDGDEVDRTETAEQAIARVVKDAQMQAEIRRAVRTDAMVPQASQALTEFINQIYMIRHRELTAWDGGYLPIFTRVDRAANDFVWYESDLQGVARAGSTYSPDDIPLVAGPNAAANRGKIVPALVGFETNFMDERRSAMARSNGKPDFRTEQRKLDSCYRVLAEFFNALWLWCDTTLGVSGLMSDYRIQVVSLTNGNWGAATGLNIKDDMTQMLDFIAQATKGELGDKSKLRLLLPRRWMTKAQNMPVTAAGTGTAASVITYIRESFGLREDQIQARDEIVATNSQAYEGGAQNLDRDRAVLTYFDGNSTDQDLSGDPAFVLSQPIELPTAPIQTGVGQVQFLHARGGGLMLPDARRVVFFEGF